MIKFTSHVQNNKNYEKLLQFVRWAACFSSSQSTLERIVQNKEDDYSKTRADFALRAREVLKEIGELDMFSMLLRFQLQLKIVDYQSNFHPY